MLNHPTGLFSEDYNSTLRGCWPLKFLHTLQLPKMYFKSYLGHRAASCWALPHISSICSAFAVMHIGLLSTSLISEDDIRLCACLSAFVAKPSICIYAACLKNNSQINSSNWCVKTTVLKRVCVLYCVITIRQNSSVIG